MRGGDIRRINGEEVHDLDHAVFCANCCAHVLGVEGWTQTVLCLTRGDGAARGEEQDFLHERISFFSRFRA